MLASRLRVSQQGGLCSWKISLSPISDGVEVDGVAGHEQGQEGHHSIKRNHENDSDNVSLQTAHLVQC